MPITNNLILDKFNKYKHYFTDLFVLSFPLLVGQLGQMLIGATDVIVVAKYNINSLAAVSIANALLFTIFIFGLGILDAISIVLSNMRGKKQRVKKLLFSSLIFAFILAVLFTLICYSTTFFIDKMGFEQSLIPHIKEYIEIVSFSIFGMYIFQGIKGFLLAYEIVNFPNFILLGTVLVNLVADIVFVFGFGIIPPLGVKGAAIATLSVRMLMAIILLAYAFKFINFRAKFDVDYVKQITKVGTPIGAALMIEFLAFNIITILVGRESGLYAATHNILITISSATFMIPLSISTAVAVKVAYYFGAKKREEMKRYSIAGLIIGVGFMAIASCILIGFPRQLIRLFTDNADVIRTAIPIVFVAATYQVFDGLQVVAGGILKGFKMTKAVSIIVLTGYWLVGLPTAIICVGKLKMSLKGYWIALAVSLLTMGIVMSLISLYKFKQLKRLKEYN